MFFPMLRRQAKWVFVLLALVFAGGFVLFGVGSGSNGLGDVLSSWLNIGKASGGPSLSTLEKRTREHPRDAKAYRELATAYEGKQRNDDAIQALERYTALRPKDPDTLQELAGLYQRKLEAIGSDYQNAQLGDPTSGRSLFTPAPTSPFGQAYASPGALGDPIAQASSTITSQKLQDLQQKFTAVATKQESAYRKVAKLQPSDPTTQYQLAQSAQSAGDTKGAIAAYERFLKLSPDDQLAPVAKQQLKQLQGSSSPSQSK